MNRSSFQPLRALALGLLIQAACLGPPPSVHSAQTNEASPTAPGLPKAVAEALSRMEQAEERRNRDQAHLESLLGAASNTLTLLNQRLANLSNFLTRAEAEVTRSSNALHREASSVSETVRASMRAGTNDLAAFVQRVSHELQQLSARTATALHSNLAVLTALTTSAREQEREATNRIWQASRQASEFLARSASDARQTLLSGASEASNTAARATVETRNAMASLEFRFSNASNAVAALATKSATLILEATTNATASVLASVYAATNEVGSMNASVASASNAMRALHDELRRLEGELDAMERRTTEPSLRAVEAVSGLARGLIACLLVLGLAALGAIVFVGWLQSRGSPPPSPRGDPTPSLTRAPAGAGMEKAASETNPGPATELEGAPPPTATIWVQKGETLLGMGQAPEAVACFEKAVAAQPANARIYLKLGQAQEKANQADAALASYDQAIRLDPTQTTAYLLKASLLNRLQREKEALACYDLALRTHASPETPPGNP